MQVGKSKKQQWLTDIHCVSAGGLEHAHCGEDDDGSQSDGCANAWWAFQVSLSVAVCCDELRCVAVFCGVLQCVAEFQCATAWWAVHVFLCVLIHTYMRTFTRTHSHAHTVCVCA